MRSLKEIKSEFKKLNLDYDTMNFDRLIALLLTKVPEKTPKKIQNDFDKMTVANLALDTYLGHEKARIEFDSLKRCQMSRDEIAARQLRAGGMFGAARSINPIAPAPVYSAPTLSITPSTPR